MFDGRGLWVGMTLALMVGCGGASRVSTGTSGGAGSPSGSEEPVTSSTTLQIQNVGATPSAGGAISTSESRITADEQVLSSASECRDICRASGDICTAAHEICSITGDGDNMSPLDGRCGRARGACSQAERQRDQSCPVCPRQ